MAIDFVIGALLLISALINALALGAFWITPGLRTTANRFVINLLIVNIIGCMVLIPTLFSCVQHQSATVLCERTQYQTKIEQIISSSSTNSDNSGDIGDGSSSSVISTNSSSFIREISPTTTTTTTTTSSSSSSFTTAVVNGNEIAEGLTYQNTTVHCANHTANRNCSRIDKRDIFFIGEINEEEHDIIYIDKSRCWGFDVITALSALSVLLIVGDTWCAITDPLRYHTRISELKAWILIVANWFVSVIFGIASAFRHEISILPHTTTWLPATSAATTSSSAITTIDVGIVNNDSEKLSTDPDQIDGFLLPPDELYDLLFSCVYFIVIILLPICLVGVMYWKIFTEARQNGLRMRQNGSSPLLQSALNLAAASAVAATTQCTTTAPPTSQLNSGGLTMKIDKHLSHCNNRDSVKPLLTPTHPRRYLDIPKAHSKDTNHNIIVTLNASNEQQMIMRRNVSAKYLTVLEHDNGDNNDGYNSKSTAMRHVRSSPNLHKSHEISTMTSTSPSSVAPVFHPTHVHIPPKALSYMTSIRHRLSNASSIFKYREESRAARISILVVIMFLISYFPYGLLVLFQSRIIFLPNSSLLAVTFLLIANISSPFLFAYRNKRVRRGVLRLFGLDPRRNVRLQKQRMSLRRNRSQTTIQINRKLSKTSNHSMNSTTKYLTPMYGGAPCGRHSLTNCNKSSSMIANDHDKYQKHFPIIIANRNDCDCNKIAKLNNVKFSLFKRVRETSLKFGCGADTCATTTDSSYHEPTEV